MKKIQVSQCFNNTFSLRQDGSKDVSLIDQRGEPALFEQVLIFPVAGIRPELQT